MALPILSYSVEYHNSLPDVADAKTQFDSVGASKTLFTDIGRIFLKYHMENTLGIVLLHHHFLLARDEMLVNVGPVAVPWKTNSGVKELENVHPSSWGFTKDGVAAYEFTHGSPRVSLDSQLQPFLGELGAILEKRKMTDLFGICALDGSIDRPCGIEFTEGRANITFPFDISPHKGSNVEAMWRFGSSKDGITSTKVKSEVQPRASNGCGKMYKLQGNTHRQPPPTGAKAQGNQVGNVPIIINRTLEDDVSSTGLGDSAQHVIAECKVRCNSFQLPENGGRSESNCSGPSTRSLR